MMINSEFRYRICWKLVYLFENVLLHVVPGRLVFRSHVVDGSDGGFRMVPQGQVGCVVWVQVVVVIVVVVVCRRLSAAEPLVWRWRRSVSAGPCLGRGHTAAAGGTCHLASLHTIPGTKLYDNLFFWKWLISFLYFVPRFMIISQDSCKKQTLGNLLICWR